MVISPLKALLFVAGGTCAAGTAAYVGGAFDDVLGDPPAMVAALPDAAQPKPEQPAAAPEIKAPEIKAPAVEVPEVKTPQPAAAPVPQAVEEQAVLPPSFDIVRVEGDGSVVIAGKASPGAAVEIIVGTTVIAKAETSGEGDFVAVLDDPLKPGNYQIVLRSTTPDNVVATSLETALVAIPEAESGQVLALVEEPGKPSKLITVPEAPKPAGQPAAADGASPKPAGEPEAPATVGATPIEGQAVPPPVGEKSVGDKPADAASGGVAPPAPGTPEKPVEVAKAKPAAPVADAPKPALPRHTVRVEAVEIEGRKVFVAGQATPNTLVRVYANEVLLGETRTSAGGRFLIETERDLAVGDYIVRADLLDDGGRTVLARAAVPFQREEGETVAAVAPAPQAADPAPKAPAEAAGTPAKAGEAPVKSGDAAKPEAPAAQPTAAAAAVDASLITAPKLEPAASGVIIRRGDTLWRISRRVYGRGVRYSTIYVANQDQIDDPHRIWPGQVFRVPEKSNEGEAADLNVLGEQMTTVTGTKPTATE